VKDWENCIADVDKILTAHYSKGRSGRAIEHIVVHYNAGDLTVEGCYSVWQTREASAHYQVESGGRIGQLVYDANTAWHAGNWDENCRSIGIEHANKEGGYITPSCMENGAHLVAALCKKHGLGRPEWRKNVFPHWDFQSTSCPGRLGDEQNAAYMACAQGWWDRMTGEEKGPGHMSIAAVEDGVHRLYNEGSGEHMWTASVDEANSLVGIGWTYEGVAFKAGKNEDAPVYRLYNPASGAHMWTADYNEADSLKAAGWTDEGVAFCAMSA